MYKTLNDITYILQYYLNEIRKRTFKTQINLQSLKLEKTYNIIKEKTTKILSGNIDPGGGYLGVWCRDASYIIETFDLLGYRNKAIEAILWIWAHQIRNNSQIVFGRGSPDHNFKSKIVSKNILEKFKGSLPTSIHRGYCEIYGENPDIDSTALIIILTCKLCLKYKSSSLIKKILPQIELAINYLKQRDLDGDYLLEQKANEDWMDIMLRNGKVVYSQAVWIEALNIWSKLNEKIGRQSIGDENLEIKNKTIKQVNRVLWNGEIYLDYRNFSKFTNKLFQDSVFLIKAGASEYFRAIKHLNAIETKLWKPIGPSVIEIPRYITKPILTTMGSYQNGAFWPWITSIEAIARAEIGQINKAIILLQKALPYIAIEWIEPYKGKRLGRYPFKTGVSAYFIAITKIFSLSVNLN